jgi:hypothetical protein
MSDRKLGSPGGRNDLDALLDRALASYTPAEPRLGLEDRVRARLNVAASSPHERTRFPLRWISAAAGAFAFAAVLTAVVLRSHTPPAPPNLAAVGGEASVPSMRVPDSFPTNAPRQPSKRLTANPAPRPRLAHDLNPRQPSQQQLIAQLLASAPEAVASLAGTQSSSLTEDQPDKPIVIEPLPADSLVIEPLKITSIDDNSADAGGKF